MPDYRHIDPPPDEYAPVIPFDLFMSRVFDWQQDQHVAIIGPTEQGKTNLAHNLLTKRSYVAYFAIKSRDKTLDALTTSGYVRSYDWPPKVGKVRKREATWEEMPKRLVWPDAHSFDADVEQKRVFGAAVRDIWSAGCIAVVWDDFWYLVNILGMERQAKKMLLNARSAECPQMIIAQRGSGNRMVELHDQPTHLFWARETTESDLQKLGPRSSIRRGFVASLDRWQFYYENTRTDQKYRITAPLLEAS